MDSIIYSETITQESYTPFVPQPLEGYYDPLFQIFFSVVVGMILAPFSLGLFLFLAVYLIFELYYAYIRGFKYTPDEMAYRALVFFVGFLGFLFGRYFSGDPDPFRMHYDEWEL